MNSRIALFILTLVVTHSGNAQDDKETAESEIELPAEVVEYEMRVGAIDLSCYPGDYEEVFSQEALVLDSKVTFSESSVLTTDPQTYAVVYVQTGVKWVGLVNKKTGEISFEAQKIVDMTPEQFKEQYGSLANILSIDRVAGEYVHGTIHGKISAVRYAAPMLKEVSRCKGEGTFIMLPKK